MINPPQIIAITQTNVFDSTNDRFLTPEEFIGYAARISNPSNQMSTATTEKLLTYLVKHSHWSPFDMVDMIIDIETSKAIAIQILRHWSFRFQEFSQRYSEVSELNFDHVEIRQKHKDGNRQGSSEENPEMSEAARHVCGLTALMYSELVQDNAAPESARMVLPMSTKTRLYMKGSVRSWMTYFWQRLDPHAQKEHRELAMQVFEIFKSNFPILGKLVSTHKPSVIEIDWIQ